MTFSRPRSTARAGRAWFLLVFSLAVLLALPASSDAKVPEDSKAAKKYKKLVEAARSYFDLFEDAWTGRKRFEVELNSLATNGEYPLADMEFLSWLVAQSRSFLPPLNDRKWAKPNDIEINDHSWWGFEIKGGKRGEQQRWAHIREPGTYVDKPAKLEKDFPRLGPWPVVLAMHAKRDPEHKNGAGHAWMQAKWDKKIHAEIYKNWFMVMPIVAAAKYTEDGVIRAEKVHGTFRDFRARYHMDFDRVVVDGTTDALMLAATNGNVYLSGVILRDLGVKDGKITDAKLAKTIKNIEHMPIYVVGKPEAAKALKAAGLVDVTEGDGKASMVKWMGDRRRVMPKKFTWVIGDKDQQMGYWVSVDQTLWDNPVRFLEVEIPEDKPNTINIKAVGANELTLFLDDNLVNLDEPVKVNINGTLVHDAKIEPRKKYIPVKRDLKEIFEKPPVEVRKHRYYGWLKSGSIVRIGVPEIEKEEKPVTPTKRATEREEGQAKKLYGKAVEVADTDKAKACKLLDRVLGLPFNAFTEKARALKAKIEGK